MHAIYNSDNKISSKSHAYNEELASIKIEVSRKKINQDLKNNLENVLNPNNIKIEPRYSINISLDKNIFSTFTTSTGSSGRNKVVMIANYKLKDLVSRELIATGTTTATDDFDVENNRFANYTAEESIASNLTLIIAQNIRNLLINDIVNSYKIRDVSIERAVMPFPTQN